VASQRFFLLLCWGEVHYGIYRSYYNISNILYLNSPPPPFFFTPLPPFMEQFQQIPFFHLHTYVHSICTIFTLLHLSPPLPHSHSQFLLSIFILQIKFNQKQVDFPIWGNADSVSIGSLIFWHRITICDPHLVCLCLFVFWKFCLNAIKRF
jgi:hypothetical protein